jgi:hypothetical protein
MLEMFFLMVSVAMQAAPIGGATVPTSSVTIPQAEERAASPDSEIIAPSFLSPVPSDEQTAAAAAPAFLAPTSGADNSAAAPAFLAPAANQAAAAPSFLAPAAKPALVAEPQTPTGRFTTATEVKPILQATRTSWILVRDDHNNQDILYVTHLWAWRCGLLELRVGINGNDPEVWPLPECHLDQPSPGATLEGDGLPYRTYQLGSIAMVEVEITYDDLSTDSAKYNRNGMLIP